MKNVKNIIVVVILLLLAACGNKTPYSVQKPLENAALVYVYADSAVGYYGEGMTSTYFNIRINNKRYLQRIRSGEYLAFDLKPEAMSISATRAQIEEKVVKLDLKAGQIYYLKIRDNLDGGRFEFEQMNEEVAVKEIAKTGLAGSSEESTKNIITEFVNSKEDKKENTSAKVESTTTAQPNADTNGLSKSDEIEKAHNLKEKGILSEEEFKALKTEILTK
ncbi:MAG: DUF2846 domain-containing protein [Campylobacterales bacterium]|nr:DUF2846 domain-containing protein [Campylobacterales bacterium]